MSHFELASFHDSDEVEAKPPSCFSCGIGDNSEHNIPSFASSPLSQQVNQVGRHTSQAGSPNINSDVPSGASSLYSNSPPSSPPSVISIRYCSTNASDGEDNNFLMTPQSKQSHSACHVAKPSSGVGSPTPSRSLKIEDTNTFSIYPMITSLDDQHYFDKFLGRPVNDEQSLEKISQRVQDIYRSHIERLSLNSVHCAVHYKEAVRECKRMRWYTARWEVTEVQRLHTLLCSLCDESETEFIMAERVSRWLLDVLVQQQTMHATATHAEYAAATCNNDKRSFLLADAELVMLTDCSAMQHYCPSFEFLVFM
ncbi:uncharacterized protein EDB93DRAFT_1253784 [Suillus bovinus]|uniref:uncharacterized protein n=1 Tax=Suillus bovinus TaxID=48563 RepID=UPI001B8673ED|nr:uncharacterized protein EDB93DRAFT_1253784 [Suillus bovinus]KAG2136923.1 hypothetical protein EDB93DRAFT_1253784 [Suillus bovinus]